MSVLLLAPVGLPMAAFLVLGAGMWFGVRWSERVSSAAVILTAAAATGCLVIAYGIEITRGVPLTTGLGSLGPVGAGLVGDHLSLPFALLGAGLGTLIGVFAQRYLHRDPGFLRFYLLLALFIAAVDLVALAASLETIVIGWEAVGLSSALLIAFFHQRRGPVAHGLRAFVTYRVCDIGLIIAALLVSRSHLDGTGWDIVPSSGAALLGLALLWAAMGKSAQFPFGDWLPRAMEGPTPSSAIFYGAVSVSMGPYLLLRTESLWGSSTTARVAIVLVGVVTAGYATLIGRTQTDIKSALAYASMTQIALVFIEVGLGWDTLALIHLITHAALRAAQILRSPSLLHDHHHLEKSMNGPLPATGAHLERALPLSVRTWLYRFALERGYTNGWLVEGLLGGFARGVRRLIDLEDRTVDRLAGRQDASDPRRVSR